MATQLESGRYQLTEEEIAASRKAVELLERRMGLSIVLTSTLTGDDWLMVLAARQLLEGRPEALDFLIAELEVHLRCRRRPH